jgi:hypothetical protein
MIKEFWSKDQDEISSRDGDVEKKVWTAVKKSKH